jgi:aminopeptidase N
MGRPVFTYKLDQENGRISRFTIAQTGEDGSGRVWPQVFEVAMVYADRVEQLTVNMDRAEINLAEAVDKATPLFVLFNASGQGYGRFPVDAAMLPHLATLKIRSCGRLRQSTSMKLCWQRGGLTRLS